MNRKEIDEVFDLFGKGISIKDIAARGNILENDIYRLIDSTACSVTEYDTDPQAYEFDYNGNN